MKFLVFRDIPSLNLVWVIKEKKVRRILKIKNPITTLKSSRDPMVTQTEAPTRFMNKKQVSTITIKKILKMKQRIRRK